MHDEYVRVLEGLDNPDLGWLSFLRSGMLRNRAIRPPIPRAALNPVSIKPGNIKALKSITSNPLTSWAKAVPALSKSLKPLSSRFASTDNVQASTYQDEETENEDPIGFLPMAIGLGTEAINTYNQNIIRKRMAKQARKNALYKQLLSKQRGYDTDSVTTPIPLQTDSQYNNSELLGYVQQGKVKKVDGDISKTVYVGQGKPFPQGYENQARRDFEERYKKALQASKIQPKKNLNPIQEKSQLDKFIDKYKDKNFPSYNDSKKQEKSMLENFKDNITPDILKPSKEEINANSSKIKDYIIYGALAYLVYKAFLEKHVESDDASPQVRKYLTGYETNRYKFI